MQGAAIKVLFFVPQLDGGGAEMNAVRLSEGLLRSGVIPSYAVSRGGGSYEAYLPPEAKVHVLLPGSTGSSTVRLLRSVTPLARLLDEIRPHVVCPVMPLPAYVSYIARYWSRHKPPIVASVQLGLKRPGAVRPDVRDWVELRLIPLVFPKFQKIIALSEGVKEDYQKVAANLHDRIDVIPNVGIPTARQLRGSLRGDIPKRIGQIRYIACGRLSPQKGYPVLLEAFAHVLQRVDAELFILGDGPMRRHLEAATHQLGIADRVMFAGFQADPYPLIESADIFVLSSFWEGFANVIVEAMSLGVPVISTDCPHGPAEIISHGRDGLLVPPGDPGALSSAMVLLAQDVELRGKLSERGRQRSADFSAERVGASYASVFHGVAAVERVE